MCCAFLDAVHSANNATASCARDVCQEQPLEFVALFQTRRATWRRTRGTFKATYLFILVRRFKVRVWGMPFFTRPGLSAKKQDVNKILNIAKRLRK